MKHSIPEAMIPFLQCFLAVFSAEGVRPIMRQIYFPHLLCESDYHSIAMILELRISNCIH
jgi:hypothetical protein